jgi:hypothetical protein
VLLCVANCISIYRSVIVLCSFVHSHAKAKRGRPLGPKVGLHSEAGKSGLRPQLPHPLRLANSHCSCLGTEGHTRGTPSVSGTSFVPTFPRIPPHSALHRSHRPKGSLRGGIPRPAAPLQHPIRKDVLRQVSILRNAVCSPRLSVVFFPFSLHAHSHIRMFQIKRKLHTRKIFSSMATIVPNKSPMLPSCMTPTTLPEPPMDGFA